MKAPTYEIDFYCDKVIADPFPHYAKMRALGPVVWLPFHENYALTQHAVVRDALRDNETFISGKGVAGDQFGCDFLQGNTVASDEPKHSELRRAMAPPLLPGALDSIRMDVQNTANELINNLLDRERFDAVADLARHLPFVIVRDMVGLPDFAQDKMLQWAGAAFDVLGVQNERGKKGLDAIADMRDFIQKDATREKLKSGSWTHRIHQLVDEGVLPCEHAGFAIRDYINPSLDTTISATGELIYQLARNADQWEALKENPSLINNAVNEAVRLGTPIRSFSRHTSRDVTIDNITIPKGARVMMIFASANRDERVFDDPDKFRLDRNSAEHIGFGSGIHMCVGMHLAQLEMEALLKAMLPRVGKISVGKSTTVLNNSIRAFASLEAVFTREAKTIAVSEEPNTTDSDSNIFTGKIIKRRQVAKDIVHFVMEPTEAQTFPLAKAGAHIDVHIRSNLVRQYSLTGKIEGDRYEIAVQKELHSKGGSVAVHDLYSEGSTIKIGKPRNSFPLVNSGELSLLFAGGIGLTPLLAMAWELYAAECPFQLHISARSKDHLAFGDELNQLPFSDRILTYFDDTTDENTKLDIASLVPSNPSGVQAYTCGPKGFMDFVVAALSNANLSKDQIHLEHFGAEIDTDGDAFTLVARQSGRELLVPPNSSILQVLQKEGIDVQTSCENGVCGSCLTPVLSGMPDHRDMVQTESEKADNKNIAVCCSRSKSKRLVLDI